MEYSIYRDVFTGLYHTILLGGEFDNCHGQGSTEDSAVASLKIRVNQLRRNTTCPKCGSINYEIHKELMYENGVDDPQYGDKLIIVEYGDCRDCG